MKTRWSPDAERLYQAQITEQLRKGCHGLALLALALFPMFGLLDLIAHRAELATLWQIRFGTVLLYLLIYVFIRNGVLTRRPLPTIMAMAALASVSLTAMCLVLGGYQSPYYAGVNLVVLALVLVLPVGARTMALGVTMIIGIYLLGILAHSGFRLDAPEALANNLYFLLATGVIGVTASAITEGLRRESFQRYLELERAQSDLKRSKDLLRMELQSEQSNVEVLVEEITARKTELERALEQARNARDEAQRALKLREEFISLASHELNTPLTSLKLQTQLAQRRMEREGTLPEENTARLVRTYGAQLERLIRIVGDMLDISRIQSGKLELERSRFDLGELVADVMERTVESRGSGSVSLRLDAPVWGQWDRFRIEQVVLNLLTNAIKYGAGQPIEIRVRARDAMAEVEVRDGGIGIPQDSLARIFDRFERAVAFQEFSGLGLGLYISRQIIVAHGGTIEAESQVGSGSTFRVRLPLAPAEALSEPLAEAP